MIRLIGISFSTAIVGMVLVGVWWEGDDGWDDDDDDDERDDNKASDREDGWESIQPIIVRGREEERDWREDI